MARPRGAGGTLCGDRGEDTDPEEEGVDAIGAWEEDCSTNKATLVYKTRDNNRGSSDANDIAIVLA